MTPGGTSGVPDRAEQERVEPPPLLDHLVGQDRAVAEIASAAEVVVDRVQIDTRGAHDLEGLGDDLDTDAVASDDANLVTHELSCRDLACRDLAIGVKRSLERENRPPGWTVEERTSNDVRY